MHVCPVSKQEEHLTLQVQIGDSKLPPLRGPILDLRFLYRIPLIPILVHMLYDFFISIWYILSMCLVDPMVDPMTLVNMNWSGSTTIALINDKIN